VGSRPIGFVCNIPIGKKFDFSCDIVWGVHGLIDLLISDE